MLAILLFPNFIKSYYNGLFTNFSDSDENSKSTLNIPGIVISALIALMLLVIISLICYAQKNNVSSVLLQQAKYTCL